MGKFRGDTVKGVLGVTSMVPFQYGHNSQLHSPFWWLWRKKSD